MASSKPVETQMPRWQLALLVGTPLVLGVGAVYLWNRSRSEGSGSGDREPGSGERSSGERKTPEGSASPEARGQEQDSMSPLDRAQAAKNKGNKYFKAGKYENAIQCYTEAIALCPTEQKTDLSTFYQNRAAAYEQQMKWAEVVQDCSQAVDMNPRYIKALFRRAKALEKLENRRECLEDVTAVCILEAFQNQQSMLLADKVLNNPLSLISSPPPDPLSNLSLLSSPHLLRTLSVTPLSLSISTPLRTLSVTLSLSHLLTSSGPSHNLSLFFISSPPPDPLSNLSLSSSPHPSGPSHNLSLSPSPHLLRTLSVILSLFISSPPPDPLSNLSVSLHLHTFSGPSHNPSLSLHLLTFPRTLSVTPLSLSSSPHLLRTLSTAEVTESSGYLKAKQFMEEENYDKIISECSKEVELGGRFTAEALLLRATFFLLIGNATSAQPDLDRVINMQDANVKVRTFVLLLSLFF
ncbi:Mitochondrial import receptor subunit TOM70 [Dissostichus eleginoides]|uniref:Mitochondrial import receptor subunit TOM70 n=1 Tax=Dissostichus eleginoides TaxID=100907 RepID=A0AAD9CAB7_DISEL|nr:Mitochondrial import receptor subunit TOM70 [Dissostichus eleginoides]